VILCRVTLFEEEIARCGPRSSVPVTTRVAGACRDCLRSLGWRRTRRCCSARTAWPGCRRDRDQGRLVEITIVENSFCALDLANVSFNVGPDSHEQLVVAQVRAAHGIQQLGCREPVPEPQGGGPVLQVLLHEGLGERHLDVGDELPDDPPAVAARLWSEGRKREALALLYRAAISWFVEHRQLELGESATEYDCVRRVASADSGSAPYFRRLTDAWVMLAYGARAVSDEEAGQLCRSWPFRSGPSKSR